MSLALAMSLAGAAFGGLGAAADRAAESTRAFDKALRSTSPNVRKAEVDRRAGGFLDSVRGGYKSRAGWTNRRYQRAALKARNVRRNRAAHR